MVTTRVTTVHHKDGTVQELKRRLLTGQTVPLAQMGRTWQELVVPGPGATGGRSAQPDHPSRKH